MMAVEETIAQEPTEFEKLQQRKLYFIHQYRLAVKWACAALDYKKRFEVLDEYTVVDIQEEIEFLQQDSVNELRRIANDIKRFRKEISAIDDELIDLARKRIK